MKHVLLVPSTSNLVGDRCCCVRLIALDRTGAKPKELLIKAQHEHTKGMEFRLLSQVT